jgi:hypothetical protein
MPDPRIPTYDVLLNWRAVTAGPTWPANAGPHLNGRMKQTH